MDLTTEQVLALAPDASAAAAARKLGSTIPWQGLGRGGGALWGECRGSALYQVRVDLADLTAKCSCSSRKLPCKHSLGLLLIAAGAPAEVPEGEPPGWVRDWLAQRQARAARRESGGTTAAVEAPAGAAPAGKRADRRQARVAAGLDALDLWLDDLLRQGLASLETQSTEEWRRQASRLVDAQAPGVAARLRRLALIPHATPDWPARLLDELGRLALLTHAFRRLDALDPALREDVRGAVGWTLGQEEVVARGETVTDEWLILGQRVGSGQGAGGEERLRAQRTWLLGAGTGLHALVLQFAHGAAPFPELLLPGTRLAADLAFRPSACPLRALVRARHGEPDPIRGPLPAGETVRAVLDRFAAAVARQPWLERLPCALDRVVPIRAPRDGGAEWLVRDGAGAALPLAGGEHWRLLALSGGAPVDLAGEWDGEALLPLGALVDGAYHLLAEVG